MSARRRVGLDFARSADKSVSVAAFDAPTSYSGAPLASDPTPAEPSAEPTTSTGAPESPAGAPARHGLLSEHAGALGAALAERGINYGMALDFRSGAISLLLAPDDASRLAVLLR